MNTLYVIGTPIENLEDITVRAARILGAVALRTISVSLEFPAYCLRAT